MDFCGSGRNARLGNPGVPDERKEVMLEFHETAAQGGPTHTEEHRSAG